MHVWKYKLTYADGPQSIEMPVGAKVLDVQLQNDAPCIWALCDEDERQLEKRQFVVCSTGERLPDDCKTYVGTVQERYLVWHIFEVTR